MRQLTLIFENQSSVASQVCVYQSPPKVSPTEAMTLAWFCQPFPQKPEGGKSQVVFQWTETENYDFVWLHRGKLGSGITFTVSQILPAHRKTGNEVTLTKSSLDVYGFTKQKQGSKPNVLFINQDRTITPEQVFVGIGMAGSATALVQALPNVMATFEIDSPTTYWIFWGNYQTSQVLNINEINNKQEIEFKGNVTSMTAILLENNILAVEPIF